MKIRALNTIKDKDEKALGVARGVARAALAAAEREVLADKFDPAKKLVDVADAAARKADAKELQELREPVQARKDELKALQEEFQRVEAAQAKLKQMADDPDANLTVGKWWCLIKGKWDDGLPLLVKGNDATLKAIAQKDVAKPAEAPAQMAVAEEWRKLAQKEKGRAKKNLQLRARHWYEVAEAKVAAAEKPKLEARLKALREATAPKGRLAPGSFYGRRVEDRVLLLRRGGGTYRSEEAVEQGLKWLSQHQDVSGDTAGKWSMNEFQKAGKCACQEPGGGYDIAGTAFGLLPMLGYGDTHTRGTYSRHIARGLSFLGKKQGERGDGSFGDNMYENALATMAMCEACGMSRDKSLRRSAQAAVNFIVYAQHEKGSWAYKARDAGDLSVSGWNFMAIKTGEMAGLEVPDEAYEKATQFLNQVMAPGGMGYGYNAPSTSPPTSAVGILLREYLGWGPNQYTQAHAIQSLVSGENFSTFDRPAIYYLYYLTQVLHHHGGKEWEVWNPRLRDMLISLQDRGEGAGILSHQKGSWSPMADTHGSAGGRIMYTSLALLILEVYYNHVPLYNYDPLLVEEP